MKIRVENKDEKHELDWANEAKNQNCVSTRLQHEIWNHFLLEPRAREFFMLPTSPFTIFSWCQKHFEMTYLNINNKSQIENVSRTLSRRKCVVH